MDRTINISSFKILFSISVVMVFLLIPLSDANTQSGQTTGRQKVTTRILFLLDGSASMLNSWENKNKMAVAKNIVIQMADSLRHKRNVEVALRVYGHQSPRAMLDCKDSRLEVNFGKDNFDFLKKKLGSLRPKGTTPIAYSLEQTAKDFPNVPGSRNIVILITDGLESCDGDPCAISLELQKKNIFLKPFIIGLGLNLDTKSAFECIGAYYNAQNIQTFKSIMDAVIDKVVHKTTVRVNLLDESRRASETDLNMTFYDAFSGVIRNNYYHTMDVRGKSDTLPIDPVNTYDIVVHSVPPVVRKNIEMKPDVMNEIDVPSPQGYLKLELQDVTIFRNLDQKIKCVVRKKGTYGTVHVQDLDTREKYLTGSYDLEILTLPRIYMDNVKISQSKTTNISIAAPGVVTILKNYPGYGGIFLEDGNNLTKIHTINEVAKTQSVALQPGHYRVIFRPMNAKLASMTIDRSFQIIGGQSTSLKL